METCWIHLNELPISANSLNARRLRIYDRSEMLEFGFCTQQFALGISYTSSDQKILTR